MVEVQSNADVEVNSIHTDTLTIGAGATLTIAPIPGGPLAALMANSALTPLATRALRPILSKPIAEPTTKNTVATVLSNATSAVTAVPLADSTVLAAPVLAPSEAATMAASSDSLSNTVLDAITVPTLIVTDTALPVRLVESTPARRIDTAINRLSSQSPIYSWLDSTALNKIIEGAMQQSLTTRNGNITSKSIHDSFSDELSLRVGQIAKHPTSPAINSRQAHIAALQTSFRRSYLDNEADFDIAQHARAGKHAGQLEKAIDEVLAEEDDAIPTLQ